MISLHSPLVHFPIGGLFIAVFASIGAFLLNILITQNKIPKSLSKLLGEEIVTKLDFVAHVAGIIGIIGIVLATFTGILDAGGANSLFITDLGIIVSGIAASLSSTLITYKFALTIFAFNIFFAAGVLRLYFVTYKNQKHFFQSPMKIQIIYILAISYGFSMLILIGAVGGILTSGSTLLSQIPFVNELLPGGNNLLLGIYLLGPAFIVLTIFTLSFIENRKNNIPAST